MDEEPTFSRLALAAALLEYDNDIDDPYKEFIDHRRSAIFRQFQEPRRPPSIPPLKTQHSGRAGLPALNTQVGPAAGGGFAGVGAGKGTPITTPISAGGARPLPMPPGPRPQSTYSSVAPESEAEGPVDIHGWGLPEHMLANDDDGDLGPPRASTSSSRPASVDVGELAASHGAATRPGHGRTISSVSSGGPARVRSVHLQRGDEADAAEFLDDLPGRHSLDAYGAEADQAVREAEGVRRMTSDMPRRTSTIASLTLEDNWDGPRADPIMVPMPGSPDSAKFRRPSPSSVMDRPRSAVIASPAPGISADDHESAILTDAFEIPAPPPELGSRFDPRRMEAQRSSYEGVAEEWVGRPPSSVMRRPSLVDMSRPSSSFLGPGSEMEIHGDGQPMYDDIPSASEYGRPLRPSKYGSQAYRMARQQLLRPKTLIMPSTLEGTERIRSTVHIPEGFMLGEKPLPEDARASILNQGKGVPLSLAQRTFASSLMVGGTRDDDFFRGTADEEGDFMPGITEEERMAYESERRKPGKLYGTSLIDQLEARKSLLSNKKRVFYGDNRPSMMARTTQRESTLFDSNALDEVPSNETGGRPVSMAPMTRAISHAHSVPTINFPEDDEEGDIGNAATTARMVKSRSVFGVDTIWEREMAKLKGIQDAEAAQKAELEAQQRAKEEAKAAKREARQSKWLGNRQSQFMGPGADGAGGDPRQSKFLGDGMGMDGADDGDMGDHRQSRFLEPNDKRKSLWGGNRKSRNIEMVENDPDFVRPVSFRFGPGGVVVPTDDPEPDLENEVNDEDEGAYAGSGSRRGSSRLSDRPPTLVLDSEGPEIGSVVPQPPPPPPERRAGSRLGVETWYEDSDDESEDNEPLSKGKGKASVLPLPSALPQLSIPGVDSDSDDEDVPLSQLKPAEDSDEEVPLSQLKKPGSASNSSAAKSPVKTVSAKSPTSGTGAAPTLPSIRAVGDDAGFKLDLPATSPISPISPISGGKGDGDGDGDEDEDDVPLFVRKQRHRASRPEPTAEEIEDDLPLGWKHAGAASKRPPDQQRSGTQSYYPPQQSWYGAPGGGAFGGYGVQSAYGVPGMGMGMPGMMPPHMMGMGGGMGMPAFGGGGGGAMPHQQAYEPPDPGRNIDNWRKQVSLAPVPTGSGQSVASGPPSR